MKLKSRIIHSPILTPKMYNRRVHATSVEILAQQLDAFRAGHLRDAALIWDCMEDRDDTVHISASKRKKAVARHSYEILTLENSKSADEHRKVLEYFYTNLYVTHAVDNNEQGGFQLLVRQMMDAVGKKYAVHEIIWRPEPNGKLTAEMRFVPLWCFENTTGKLRFCPYEYSDKSLPLEPGGWMVTVGEGLMMACSIACLYKQIPLIDWLSYCQKHGVPAVIGKTAAARGSAAWNEMIKSLDTMLSERDPAILISDTDQVDLIRQSSNSAMPFPELVDEMTRAIISLWRGGDLSTRSERYSVGASMQQDEALLLEIDDSEWISETLHAYLDKWIIHYVFGEDVTPLARIHLRNIQKTTVDTDLRVDEFLLRHNAPLSLTQTLERYQRSMPSKEEKLLTTGNSQ